MVLDISLGVGVPCLVSGLGTSFLPLCLFGFEVLQGSRVCSVGVLHFLRFFFLLSPRRSSVLRIGSNPAEAFNLGRTDGESNSLDVVVHQVALGEPPFPLDKGKGKINEIRYPNDSEYLRAAIQNAEAHTLVGSNLYTVRSLRPGMGLRLGPRFGALTC